jgi:proteic killer suppression protein
MILSFRHAGLKRFFLTGSKAGIQPAHARKLAIQLFTLDLAKSASDMAVNGWDLHPLGGDLAGHWSTKVNANWRMVFTFDGEDAILVDYRDYH